ncbi:Histamine H1 receptor [Branchiostoma belcheri]|nr:Histamine H1 receptor [Branchiostoma belcheri]
MAFNITCQLTAATNSSSPLELLLPCNATGGPDVWSAGSLSPDGRLWRYTTTAVWKDTALGIVLACLCLVTCVGNAMVLHAVRTNKELQTVSNFFIVSLAVSDLVVGTGVMSLSTAYILAEEWRFGLALCQARTVLAETGMSL